MSVAGIRRPLNTRLQVESFVCALYGDRTTKEERELIIDNIIAAEANLRNVENRPTATHEDFRKAGFRTHEERKVLRETILRELIDKERLPDDDGIGLGIGGARPAVVKRKACAYVVSGAPASGKSGVAVSLADRKGAYVLDSDYAKRKFPEYSTNQAGASLVHQEADRLVFGESESLWEYCIYERVNVVIPLVGKTVESVEEICEKLEEAGYKIHMINVVLDRYECTRRAYRRYCETKRYVPLSYVFDEVGNEPERVYFLCKRKHRKDKAYVSFTQLSTDVPKGAAPKILERTGNSPYT